MFSSLYPPLCPSKSSTSQWGATSAGCQHGLCFHGCTDVGHRGRDRTWRPQARSVDAAQKASSTVNCLQALPLCRLDVCVTSNSSTSAAASHSVLFQIGRRCLQGRGRAEKKASLLDGGHAEVKDDYILLGLPAVIAPHFSSTQRQGREWLWTPITLMSPRPAMRSS